MNVIDFESKSCERIRRYLDSYLSDELLVETNLEVGRHLENCPRCAAAFNARLTTRNALRRACGVGEAPAQLRLNIQRAIHVESERARPSGAGSLNQWMMVAAASIIIGFAGWLLLQYARTRQIEAPTASLAAAFNVGMKDHIHCALGTWYRDRRFTDERMARDLGPDFAGLAPLVRNQTAPEFEIVVAHQCQVDGRNFVHLILQKPERTVSLIVTKKMGESFVDPVARSLQRAGLDLHHARIQDFELAGFETRDFLVYLISDLPANENFQIARELETPLREFLARLEA